MNDSSSIVEFFYNLVPGSLFLFLLKPSGYDIFEKQFPSSDSALKIFAYIIAGLLLGFIFQGVTKWFRDHFEWNLRTVKQIRCNKLERYKLAYKKIFNKEYKESEDNDPLLTFYLMDSELSGDDAALLPTRFYSIHTFWSNIFFAIILLLFLTIFKDPSNLYLFSLVLTLILSLYWANKYLEGFYDTTLNVFYMKYRDKKH